MNWKQKSPKEIVQAISKALNYNLKYSQFTDKVMGFPGSYLDTEIFKEPASLDDNSTPIQAYLRVLWENPNHIGCHTSGKTTPEFKGTHPLEKELLRICAEEILRAEKDDWDGYVASGGTEANIAAMWIFRNMWLGNSSGKARRDLAGQIHIIASRDAHYSLEKAADLLGISSSRVSVSKDDKREIELDDLIKIIEKVKAGGVEKFLFVLNMGSTNFGSVDDVDRVSEFLNKHDVKYEIHVDAAFGGFIYPFTNPNNKLTFEHPKVMSFTLDAHKMLQAPYGTGIFITRKNRIESIKTASATYILGSDNTVCGSRSGANAIAVWMILQAWGSEGGEKFCKLLITKTNYLCAGLKALKVKFYRNEFMNVVGIDSNSISGRVAKEYHLQPDEHEKKKPGWWRVVVMQHVSKEMIDEFLKKIREAN